MLKDDFGARQPESSFSGEARQFRPEFYQRNSALRLGFDFRTKVYYRIKERCYSAAEKYGSLVNYINSKTDMIK